jgi:ATP-dependent DNA ligase
MFKAFEFCLPTNATKVPAGPDWLHEIKQDGFRIRVERDGDRVRLITRGGYDWTKRYPWIAGNKLPQSNVKQRNTVLPGGHRVYFDGRRR